MEAAHPESRWPLQCSVCPEQPQFSDISHLLTHLASKSHLSFKYKLDVYATQNEQARLIIQEYDAWYKKGNVHWLMAQRLSQKDKERLSERLRDSMGNPLDLGSIKSSTISTDTTPLESAIHSPMNFDNLDPRLMDVQDDNVLPDRVSASIEALYPKLGQEQTSPTPAHFGQSSGQLPWNAASTDNFHASPYGSSSLCGLKQASDATQTPSQFDLFDTPAGRSLNQAALESGAQTQPNYRVPSIHWFQDSETRFDGSQDYTGFNHTYPPLSFTRSSIPSPPSTSSAYSIPNARYSTSPSFSIQNSSFGPNACVPAPNAAAKTSTASKMTSSTSQESFEEDVEEFRPSILILKGTVYPGMDVWDSAPKAEGKRRNQKKPESVLERLEARSGQVDASEFTWKVGQDWKWIMDKQVGQLTPESSPVLGALGVARHVHGGKKSQKSKRVKSNPVPISEDGIPLFRLSSTKRNAEPVLAQADGIGSSLALLTSGFSHDSHDVQMSVLQTDHLLRIETTEPHQPERLQGASNNRPAPWPERNIFDDFDFQSRLVGFSAQASVKNEFEDFDFFADAENDTRHERFE